MQFKAEDWANGISLSPGSQAMSLESLHKLPIQLGDGSESSLSQGLASIGIPEALLEADEG